MNRMRSEDRRTAHRPSWAWALVGLAIGACMAALAWAPARWLAAAVRHYSAGVWQLEDAQGSLWNGSARLSLGPDSASTERRGLPGRLTWTLTPSLAGLDGSILASCCMKAPLAVHLTPGAARVTARVDAFASDLPLGLLAGLGTPWNTIDPQGLLSVQSPGLHVQWALGRWRLDGQLSLEARDLVVRLSSLQPIGSYRVQVQGGDTPSLQLQTVSGALILDGRGQWSGGRLHFQGEARAAPSYEDALSNLLNIVGRRNGARSIITLG